MVVRSTRRLSERADALEDLSDPVGLTSPLWTAPAPVVVTDTGGMICFANAAFARLLGSKSSDYVGHAVLEFVLPEDWGLLVRKLSAVAHGESTRDLLVRVRAAGRVLPCLVGGAIVEHEGLPRLTWVVVRPSMWSADPGPAEVTDLALGLSRLALSRAPHVEPLRHLGQAASWCREVTGNGSEVSLVVSRDHRRDVVVSTSEATRSWGWAQLDAGEGPVVAAFRDNKLVRAADLGRDPRYPALAGAVPPGHSAVSSPVTVENSVVGALTVYDPRPGLLESDDLVMPSLAAATSSIASEFKEAGPDRD